MAKKKNTLFFCSPSLAAALIADYVSITASLWCPHVNMVQGKSGVEGTFHWQSMSGWVDSVLILDNGASHVWLTPLSHIGVSSTPSGCENGPTIHWGTRCVLCVWARLSSDCFSAPGVPISDCSTGESQQDGEQGHESRSTTNNAAVRLGTSDKATAGFKSSPFGYIWCILGILKHKNTK